MSNSKMKLQLHTQQNGRCWYCGQAGNFSDMEIEHQIPKSKGGTDTPDNLVLSCRPCNRHKSNLTMEEYRTLKSLNYRINRLNFRLTPLQVDTLVRLDRLLKKPIEPLPKVQFYGEAGKFQIEIPGN